VLFVQRLDAVLRWKPGRRGRQRLSLVDPTPAQQQRAPRTAMGVDVDVEESKK